MSKTREEMVASRTTRALISVCVTMATLSTLRAELPQGYFTDIRPVLTSSEFSDFEMAASADGLTLFFTNDGSRGGEGAEDIWMATRTDVSSPFDNIVNLGPTVNSAENDGVGSVSADGLTLYFGSNRVGGQDFDLYQATRSNTSEPFDNVMSLGSGVNTAFGENAPRVTPDGLTMVFHRSDPANPQRDVWLATRESVNEPFGEATVVLATEYQDWWPSISADGMNLFLSDWVFDPPRPGGVGSIDIWVSTRDDATEMFGPPVNLNDAFPGTGINTAFADAVPYVSPDWPAVGSKLYFASNSLTGVLVADVFQATWVPEPTTWSLGLIGLAAMLWRRGRMASNRT